jgi:hypothetical protein
MLGSKLSEVRVVRAGIRSLAVLRPLLALLQAVLRAEKGVLRSWPAEPLATHAPDARSFTLLFRPYDAGRPQTAIRKVQQSVPFASQVADPLNLGPAELGQTFNPVQLIRNDISRFLFSEPIVERSLATFGCHTQVLMETTAGRLGGDTDIAVLDLPPKPDAVDQAARRRLHQLII